MRQRSNLAAYLEPNPAGLSLPDCDLSATPPVIGSLTEALLERSERDVDRAIGPRALQPNGLKLNPSELTDAQRAALSRAMCAAAEFRLQVGEDELVGDSDFVDDNVTILRRAPRQAPKVMEELAGFGLLAYSGCAAPTAA